jgi:hypothetical protein
MPARDFVCQKARRTCGVRKLGSACKSAPLKDVSDFWHPTRVDVDHSPDHGPGEHLPQRLGRFEAVAGRNRHPPGGDLLRAELAYPQIAEHPDRFREQPA